MTNDQQSEEPNGSHTAEPTLSRRRTLGVLGAGALALGGVSGTASGRTVHGPSDDLAAGGTAELDTSASDSVSESAAKSDALVKQFDAVYAATRKYQDVAVAKRDGYIELGFIPGVGHVYPKPARIPDGEVDITKPGALVYVAANGDENPADADLDLAALEYVVPGDQSANPPDVFADEHTSYPLAVTEEEGWHHSSELGHSEEVNVTGLHVWLHHWNLAGLFSATNPVVSLETHAAGETDDADDVYQGSGDDDDGDDTDNDGDGHVDEDDEDKDDDGDNDGNNRDDDGDGAIDEDGDRDESSN